MPSVLKSPAVNRFNSTQFDPDRCRTNDRQKEVGEIPMTKVAVLVELKAKPGKEQELATLLVNDQPIIAAEPFTVGWSVLRPDPQTFVIFHAFDGEDGLQAHMSGPIAAALLARVDELLAEPPQLRQAEVLVDLPPIENAH
jgi:quinol monooxygenase YgiN